MNLIILGAGGFGQSIADVSEQSGKYAKIQFLDDNSTVKNVIGKCSDYLKYKDCVIYPAFGNNSLRIEWIEKLLAEDFFLSTIIHRTAYISPKAIIGHGTVVLPHSVINTNCQIGKGCIINCNSTIDHGCIIEDGVHICLGAIVKAENRITKYTKIEAGEVVHARAFPV